MDAVLVIPLISSSSIFPRLDLRLNAMCMLGLVALDWLGMGLSSRPSPKAFDPPPKTSLPESVESRVKRAEDFFIDSLEAWREKGGYEKMTLIGHSLGGYLSAGALRFLFANVDDVNSG